MQIFHILGQSRKLLVLGIIFPQETGIMYDMSKGTEEKKHLLFLDWFPMLLV